MMSFSLILILFLTVIAITESKCPTLSQFPHCKCRDLINHGNHEFSILSCYNLLSENDLKSVLAATRGYAIFQLEIMDSTLRYIPDDAFEETEFEVLVIRSSSLHSLSDTDIAFKGLENKMRLIKIMNCSYISDWDWSQLSKLVHLREIQVSHSDLLDITEALSGIQHIDVRSFAFQLNRIQVLNEQAFASFRHLETLSLNNNQIKRLSRSMFPKPAKNLQSIQLSYNDLRDLPANLFVDMPALSSLYLTGNPLHTIDESVFKSIWNQLRVFLFSDTNLSCDCRLKWLVKKSNSNKMMQAECQSPALFRGRDLRTVKDSELYC